MATTRRQARRNPADSYETLSAIAYAAMTGKPVPFDTAIEFQGDPARLRRLVASEATAYTIGEMLVAVPHRAGVAVAARVLAGAGELMLRSQENLSDDTAVIVRLLRVLGDGKTPPEDAWPSLRYDYFETVAEEVFVSAVRHLTRGSQPDAYRAGKHLSDAMFSAGIVLDEVLGQGSAGSEGAIRKSIGTETLHMIADAVHAKVFGAVRANPRRRR